MVYLWPFSYSSVLGSFWILFWALPEMPPKSSPSMVVLVGVVVDVMACEPMKMQLHLLLGTLVGWQMVT